jgi:4,5-dihydroxyphthalate decarboxylase
MVTRERFEVSIALWENPRTRPLIDGTVEVDGLRLIPSIVHPSEMFWRQLHFADFDISEMSLSSLFIAAGRGDRTWAAIPVYTMRRFFHTSIMVRRGSGISEPKDLVGRRVGVPEYQQTSAIWARGVLEDFYGIAATDIDWYMERGPDRSHGAATGFVPPPGVRLNQIPPDKDIGDMLASGELDATLLYINHRNLVDRSRHEIRDVAEPLFRDRIAEERRYHKATGLFPINHALVVRRTLLDRHPWIALNLFNAFERARVLQAEMARAWIGPFIDLAGATTPDIGPEADPMGYGFARARSELEAVSGYLLRQGLTDRQVTIEEAFAESTLAL